MTLIAICRRAFVRRGAGFALALLVALVPLSLPISSWAQVTATAQSSERSVMAAYLYRFMTYVEWPVSAFPNADSPIVIGVVGADDIATELEQITQGRTAQNRRLQVRRIAPGDAWTGVHVLFIGRDGASKLSPAAKALAERSVLTITDAERGIENVSVINFVQLDGRVRFEVNVALAEKSGLRLSSRLLSVATRVKAS